MNINDNLWKDFPDELRDMLILFRQGNIYVFPGIIKFLLDQRYKVEHSNKSTDKNNYLIWINRFFSDILYPYEFSEDLWQSYSSQLEDILQFSVHILSMLDKDKSLNKYPLTENGDCPESDLVAISQNVDIYRCTLYYTQKRTDEYSLQIKKILESTKRNIKYLLSNPNVEELYKMNITLNGFDMLGAAYFEEPLSFTSHEFLYSCDSTLMKAYAEYYDFLEKMDCQDKAKDILNNLRDKAKNRLHELGRSVLTDIDESISNAYEEIQELINKREENGKVITDRC